MQHQALHCTKGAVHAVARGARPLPTSLPRSPLRAQAACEGSRVTGQILAVLFADHVKQLKRMPGVW